MLKSVSTVISNNQNDVKSLPTQMTQIKYIINTVYEYNSGKYR